MMGLMLSGLLWKAWDDNLYVIAGLSFHAPSFRLDNMGLIITGLIT